MTPNSAERTLELLREGNARFVGGKTQLPSLIGPERISKLVAGQSPHSVILGCSDSRVPPEIVFDQGPGDLFVIRVAGNIVGPSQIGSIEFAVEKFGTGVVVVLGHSRCGAVMTTLEQMGGSRDEGQSPNLEAILERVRPAVAPLIGSETSIEDLIEKAVRANIRAAVDRLREGSPMLGKLADVGELVIVGAEYSLQTGSVEFF